MSYDDERDYTEADWNRAAETLIPGWGDEPARCDCGHSGTRHGPEMGCIECRCPLDGVR